MAEQPAAETLGEECLGFAGFQATTCVTHIMPPGTAKQQALLQVAFATAAVAVLGGLHDLILSWGWGLNSCCCGSKDASKVLLGILGA